MMTHGHVPQTSQFFANSELTESSFTIGDLLRDSANAVADRVALKESPHPATGRQREWTYSAILHGAERTARALLGRFEPGEHVAIWAPNLPEWWFFEFGAALAGIVLVTVNTASRQQELAYILENSNAAGLLTVKECRGTDHVAVLAGITDKLPQLREIILFEEWETFISSASSSLALPTVRSGDPAMIQYTSGTTGKPKGARLSHRGFVNSSRFATECFALETGSVWLNCMPMFHTGGSVHSTLGTIWNRGTMIMAQQFDPGLMLRMIDQEKANWITTVPTMAIALLEHPSFGSFSCESLRLLACGGAPVAPELVERIEREFGCDFVMLFGQTEMSGMICQSRRPDTIEHLTKTVGSPLGPVEVRIADPTSGGTLAIDTVGEICLRGFGVLIDYYGNPSATAQAIDQDGWFHTGDLGTVRGDHYLTITGRLKDMVIRGGENIYPREIEDELLVHPSVSDVAVFGVPDVRWGEQIVAAVRSVPNKPTTESELRAFLESRMAKFKVPRYWWFVEIFPTTLSGKIQKFALRDQFLSEHRSA